MTTLGKVITHPIFHAMCEVVSVLLCCLCLVWALHNASIIAALISIIPAAAAILHFHLLCQKVVDTPPQSK